MMNLETYNGVQELEKRMYEFVQEGEQDHTANRRVKILRNAFERVQEEMSGDF